MHNVVIMMNKANLQSTVTVSCWLHAEVVVGEWCVTDWRGDGHHVCVYRSVVKS